MNYNYVNVFYTVAKLQNISKAAEKLNVTQPAVSRIITTIENKYSIRLFLRSKYGVVLTKEGQRLFDMIKGPFSELEQVEASLQNDISAMKVTVHIGATATALHCFLFQNLEKIKKQFPSINFRIYSDSSHNLLKKVVNGDIDFAFITTPFGDIHHLYVENIFEIQNILIAPMSYQNRIGSPTSIKSVADFPFILLNKDMQFREYIDDYLAKNGVSINPAYETDSSSDLLPFVENNYGLTFVPKEMAEQSIKEGKCFEIELLEKMSTRYISFAMRRDKKHSDIINDIKKALLKMR